MALRSLWDATTRYVRTNRARVLFLSVAGVGVAATGVFLHGQYRRLNAFMDMQRQEGARALRAVFVGNSQTVLDALNALLPLMRELLRDAPRAEADDLVAALRDPSTDKQKKRVLWERLKVCTIVELVGAAYLVAAVHAVLSLQVNLLSRYSRTDDTAPVQPLPSRTLRPATKAAFLGSVREHVLSDRFLDALLASLSVDAAAELADVPLKGRLRRGDVDLIAAGVRGAFRTRSLHELTGDWLFAVEEADEMDDDFRALIDESLDLALELDVSAVVHAQAEFLVSAALDGVSEEEWGGDEGVPMAQLLAPLHKAGGMLLERVPDGLGGERAGQQFAAAVLISGEPGGVDPLPDVPGVNP